MSNPTTCGVTTDWEPCLFLTSNFPASIAIDPDKQYQLWHTGIDATGNATTDSIMGATGTSTAALTAGTGQFTLVNGVEPIFLGPGISKLTFDAVGNDPVVCIVPVKFLRGTY